jgi:hypothetical protein
MFERAVVQKYTNIATIIILFLITLGLGGLFGYKFRDGQVNKEPARIVVANEEVQKLEAKVVDGVQFIKANQPKTCDQDHPIKGTFNNDGGNFYNKVNKQYDRIKPDICFVNEDFAQNIVGFIKKF